MNYNSNVLVVFDLDFTIWNAGNTWCDHLTPPFSKSNNRVIDNSNSIIKLYPDVLEILDCCDSNKFQLGLASRTGAPSWARELLSLHNIAHRFQFQEIYPGSKIQHFKKLNHQSNIPYSNMFFFDDEQRNINEVEQLGVHCTFVPNGLTKTLFNNALETIKN